MCFLRPPDCRTSFSVPLLCLRSSTLPAWCKKTIVSSGFLFLRSFRFSFLHLANVIFSRSPGLIERSRWFRLIIISLMNFLAPALKPHPSPPHSPRGVSSRASPPPSPRISPPSSTFSRLFFFSPARHRDREKMTFCVSLPIPPMFPLPQSSPFSLRRCVFSLLMRPLPLPSLDPLWLVTSGRVKAPEHPPLTSFP